MVENLKDISIEVTVETEKGMDSHIFYGLDYLSLIDMLYDMTEWINQKVVSDGSST